MIDAIVAGLSKPGLDDVSLDLAGPTSLPQRELIARAGALYDNKPSFVPIPMGLAKGVVALLESVMSNPPFTRTSLEVICEDDDVNPKPACEKLGIELTPLDEILRRCVGPEAPDS